MACKSPRSSGGQKSYRSKRARWASVSSHELKQTRHQAYVWSKSERTAVPRESCGQEGPGQIFVPEGRRRGGGEAATSMGRVWTAVS